MTKGFWTRSKASGVLLLVLLLVLWQLAALYWVDSPNWPSLGLIATDLVAGLESGELLKVFASSLYVMIVGYVVGVGCAVVIGLLMASVRPVHALLNPIVELLRPIPIPAIVPPLILLLGLDDALKIFTVAFAVFFPVLVNTVAGARATDRVAVDVARTFGVGRMTTLRSVVLPASLPYIFAGMRVSLSLALIITVTAEMLAGSTGIGYFLMTTQYSMRASQMYGAIMLLAAVGYLLNRAFLAAEHRMIHWFHRSGIA